MTDNIIFPKDVIGEILAHCDYYTLFMTSLVNKVWYDIAMNPIIYFRAWEITKKMIQKPVVEDSEFLLTKLMKHPVVRQMTDRTTIKLAKVSVTNRLISNWRISSVDFIQRGCLVDLQFLVKTMSHVRGELFRRELVALLKKSLQENWWPSECVEYILGVGKEYDVFGGPQWSHLHLEDKPYTDGWSYKSENIFSWCRRVLRNLNAIDYCYRKITKIHRLTPMEMVWAGLDNSDLTWSIAVINTLEPQLRYNTINSLAFHALQLSEFGLLDLITQHYDFEPDLETWDELIKKALNLSRVPAISLFIKHEWFPDFSLHPYELLSKLIKIGDHQLLTQYITLHPKVASEHIDSNLLLQACFDGNLDIAKVLLTRREVIPSYMNNKPLRVACKMGRLDIVKLLVEQPGVDVTVNDQYCLLIGCEKGHPNIVEYLLGFKQVHPSALDNYAIKIASEYGYTAIVKLLLNDPRVDPGSQNNYALRYAHSNGHSSCEKYLTSHPKVDPSVLLKPKQAFHVSDNSSKTVLNESDTEKEPILYISATCKSGSHSWHLCRSTHKPPGNHIAFPTICKGCKNSQPFTATLCTNCNVVLCVQCRDQLK